MNCILDILGQFPGASCLVSAGSLGCALGNLGRDAVGNRNRGGDGKKYIADVFNVMADAASTIFCSTGGIMKSKAKLVAEDAVSEWTGELLGITASFLNGEMPNNPFLKLTAIPVTIPGSCFTAFASPPKSIERFFIKDVSSMDPNDKTGPLGITTDNFIDKESTLQYLIRFENISTATAPASEVRIIDTLDNNFFDLSTLRFTGFGFADSTYQVLGGSESYVQEIDLRPAKNTIVRFTAKLDTVLHTLSWLFESLDPVTRELVADPNDGFLNPNQQSPEGEGFVSFSVRPLANRPHLQQVMNTAKIVFDENAPIFTNVWKNTVDIEKPSSQVLPLPAVLNDTTFLLRWSGTDAHAGIMGYDIYAIINDTITRRILRNTPTDSIRINGAFGNTYKFFSVASDLVGNIEDLPGVPDAVITLSAPLPLTILSFTGSRQNNDAVLQWRTVNEVSVSHFEVQRSFNGADFTKEGTVTAGGTLYSLTDPGVFNTQPVVYYRLKSVDIDGRFTYSAILKLSRNENGLLTVFPNPVKDQLVIGGLKRGAVLRIFSADGRLVQQTAVTTQTMIIDMIGYTSGIYWLQYASDGEIQTQKILKQ
ncbi:MAG: T9SS type A sorting domain-containing protein [Chitinophagaceae bacterium]|nr:T9SS type A sorting domain-containing protein [Chitinophagaceae bacterium]